MRLYYDAKDEWEYAVMNSKKILFPWRSEADVKSEEEFKALKKNFEEKERMISQMFLQAVNHHDGEMIMNLAKAAWFFEGKRKFRTPDFQPADRERTLLIFLKTILEHKKEKASIRTVAKFLRLDNAEALKKMKTPEDGFSALRRKCIQLGVPLAESRKGKRK
jgi:hypothetical protein